MAIALATDEKPWHTNPKNGRQVLDANGDEVVIVKKSKPNAASAWRRAKKISKVPELLNSLIEVLESLKWHANTANNGTPEDQERIDRATAVISEATRKD